MFTPNDKPRKMICYQIFDNTGKMLFAGWDEDNRDKKLADIRIENPDASAYDAIVVVKEAEDIAKSKLNPLDKLVLGFTSEPKKVAARQTVAN